MESGKIRKLIKNVTFKTIPTVKEEEVPTKKKKS